VVEVDVPFPVLKLLPLESVAIPSLMISVTLVGAGGAVGFPGELVGVVFDIENELVESSYVTEVPGDDPWYPATFPVSGSALV
jgi:hypothetical protein